MQIHALRKLLGQERVETDGPGYRLLLEPGELDLQTFEELFSRGKDELASGAADDAAKTFRSALDLWRGPPLADVAYAPVSAMPGQEPAVTASAPWAPEDARPSRSSHGLASSRSKISPASTNSGCTSSARPSADSHSARSSSVTAK